MAILHVRRTSGPTRRTFLGAMAALPLGLRALAQKHASPHAQPHALPGSPRWAFLGTDTGKGIYRAPWNAAIGTLGSPVLAAEAERPDFFTLHPTLPILYTVNSVSGPHAGVAAFTVDPMSGSLTPLSRMGTHGDGPCFLSVDRTGHAAYAANYSAGSVTAYRLSNRGEFAEIVGVLAYKQPQHGPVADRQDGAHLHCTTLAPNNDFLVVCDLGDDLLLVFPIAPEAGASIQAPLRFKARPGSGPRHVAFHPNGKWLYCIHELDCTVDLYDWSVTGRAPNLSLRPGSSVSTVRPGDPPANNSVPEPARPSTGCEVLVSDDGRFLTTCTRGADNLVVYRIDPQTGLLTEQQRLSCGGRVPRLIAFDPSHRWLLAMNQASSNVTVFANARPTGRLNPKFRSFTADTPMCVAWI
jgi:6-phosphogluconolactonase